MVVKAQESNIPTKTEGLLSGVVKDTRIKEGRLNLNYFSRIIYTTV